MQKNGLQLIALIAVTLVASISFAQDEPGEQTLTSDHLPGVRFSKPVTSEWEFGLIVKGKGKASGITATAPLPVDWPEQKIEVIKEKRSSGINRISYKNLTGDSRQMLAKINRLSAGESAEAIVQVRVIKSNIAAPKDPSKLMLAKKVPSKFKKYLRPSPFIESSHKRIKEIAKQVGNDEGLSDWEQVEAVYKWVRENVTYKFDVQIHSCLDALDSGHGDCEELSSLFIAICRAKNIPARAVWIPGHTYPEFYMTDEHGEDHWIPCQAAGSYQFGCMTESRPILQKGDRFKLPGNPKPVRYIQPTLVAKDAPGGLGFEWVSRQSETSDSAYESSARDR